MIDIMTNNVRQIGTPMDEGGLLEKAYKRIKTDVVGLRRACGGRCHICGRL